MTELQDKKYQYSTLLNYNEMNKKTKMRYIILFRIVFTMLCAAAAAVFIMNIAVNYEYIAAIAGSAADKKLKNVKTAAKPVITPSRFNFRIMSRYQNILLLGVDSNGPDTLPFSGVRSDTILILSIDNRNKSINAVSIPRDSKVYLADEHGVQKINAAYAIGGINLAKKTIEETLGIKIHNYIIINAQGVRKLIDAIGGVPVHISRNMDYDDKSAGLHIHFKKGDYILDGKKAEEYLRYRKDYLGDIGRVQRQQHFLNSLIEKFKSPDIIKNLPDILKIAEKYSKTDLNIYQFPQYISLARELDMNKSNFAVLPGAPNKKGAVSYWILDSEKTQEMIYSLIYRRKIEKSLSGLSAGLIYTQKQQILAAFVRDELKSAGYEVNCAAKTSQIDRPVIIGYNSDITSEMIKDLKEKVPETADYSYIHKISRPFCPSSDIVIMLADK